MATKYKSILNSRPKDFWNRFHVFPALFKKNSVRNYVAQARARLKRCGTHNVVLLAETFGVPVGKSPTPEGLAGKLLGADKSQSIIGLAEFIRGKGKANNEEYDSQFSDRKRRAPPSCKTRLGRANSESTNVETALDNAPQTSYSKPNQDSQRSKLFGATVPL